MARGDAITWPEWEEKNLPHWLFQHRKLSWKARSKAYFRQYRIKRSGESLRGKQNDLRRRSRMQNEPVTPQPQATPRRTLLPHRHATASLPSFTLHDSSLKVYRLLEAIREAGAIRWSPLLKISTRRRKQGERQIYHEFFPDHETNASQAQRFIFHA